MKSFLKISLLIFLSLALFTSKVYAQEEFEVTYNTTYEIKQDGSASVSQEVTLTNKFSKIYASSYSLILEGKKPQDIMAEEGGQPLTLEILEEGGQTKITTLFPDALVGKDKSRTFLISYKLPKVAIQNGEVWDLTIPRLASPEFISQYSLLLRVPKTFGKAAYISPEPRSQSASGEFEEFSFQKSDLTRAGVVAAFGQFQVFSFSLQYHLQNPHGGTGETEIALPPDTAFQRVYYEKLEPLPQSIRLDEDGNWLAKYRLGGGEKISILALGQAQIFSEPQEQFARIVPEKSNYYLEATQYWQVHDPAIQKAATSLKTSQDIHNFVTTNLEYNYSRVDEGVERLGASGILTQPQNAICMEFTDLFIALSRASGIPAREVNGYAYTENKEIQPLSLVADVLHSWPEYWNEEEKIWQPVDPTWENTTGGVDFFNKFDLSHFTFVIHGKDPVYPLPAGSYKLGDNPQKDVEVRFGKLPESRSSNLDIEVNPIPSFFLVQGDRFEVKITNNGPVALYDTPVELVLNGGGSFDQSVKTIPFLAPFDSTSLLVTFKNGLFSFENDKSVTIFVADTSSEYELPVAKMHIQQILTIFALLAVAGIASFLLIRYVTHRHKG